MIRRQGSQALNGCEPMTGLLKKLRRASLKEKPWPANLLPACHHQLAWILLWSCVAVLGIVGLLAFDQKYEPEIILWISQVSNLAWFLTRT